MTTARSHEAPAAMIDRVASLLQVFDGGHRFTLAEVSRRAGLPRSSAHRILGRLVDLGWIERRGFEYALGIRMFELGSQVVRRDGVHQAALPHMHALHRSTGLTVHLSALQSGDVLHLERIGGWPEKGEGWRLGARQPAVHSAAGRALLAQLDDADWPDLTYPAPATPGGVRTETDLRREIDRVRDHDGVAVDAEGCSAGVIAVAAAIGPAEDGLSAALSLCGPAAAVPVDRAVAAVRRAATDIWYAAAGVTRLRGRPTRPVHAALPLAEALTAVARG
ncbi:transcriptional regulator, IclR family [Lentzea fradiae]|uniref:Transcriptional regulator, IclR family n=1 Tax=Lentzea fradiae TaxID=200378 RepID=A0A1G7WFL4_9PSEU|nr:helix-turn-helix domain-containing protein [Lentzea fradiae]SDG70752.1 transcriptional regulator, IclR family [Lentzea fradiae]